MTTLKRHLVAILVTLVLSLLITPAIAGSYLNRAALLLNGSSTERNMVEPRSQDKELLLVVHEIAKARTRAARNMEVPKAIASAHPHLLLVMENTERAYSAAIEGSHAKFLTHLARARSEDATFRAIVEKLGYTLPKTP